MKAAVSEISKLVDDKCAFLHLEISRKQNENENLRRRLAVMENKNAELQRGFGKNLRLLMRYTCDMCLQEMKIGSELHHAANVFFCCVFF